MANPPCISAEDGPDEEEVETTEVPKEKHVSFPGVFGSKDFVAHGSESESYIPERMDPFGRRATCSDACSRNCSRI